MNVAACAGRAKHITDRLRAMGHANAEARYVDTPQTQGVVCNFVLVAQSPAWRKPFVLDPADATAEAFLSMFDQWQANMREALAQNRPGPHLAGAVAAHGAAALKAIGQAMA